MNRFKAAGWVLVGWLVIVYMILLIGFPGPNHHSSWPRLGGPLNPGRVGYLGVKTHPKRANLDSPVSDVAAIIQVDPNSPAGRMGLKPGEWIVAIDGEAVADPKAAIQRHKAGQEAEMVLVFPGGSRGHSSVYLYVRLDGVPNNPGDFS